MADIGRWAELRERKLSTPELQERYEHRRRAVALTRKLLMQIDAERERAGLTKAELARRVGMTPSVVRRLFAAHPSNPTLHTVLDLLDALGMEIEARNVGGAERNTSRATRRSTIKD